MRRLHGILVALVPSLIACGAPDGVHTAEPEEPRAARKPSAAPETGGAPSAEAEEGSGADKQPTWLAGSYRRACDLADFCSERIDLARDGSGERSFFLKWDIPYLPGETRTSDVAWSSDGKVLTMNGQELPVLATPNCRLIQLGDHVYSHVPDAACPFELPPLEAFEESVLGTWSLDPSVGKGAARLLRLHMDDQRGLSFTFRPGYNHPITTPNIEVEGYFTVVDGVLVATGPDEQPLIALGLERDGEHLSLCDTKTCFPCSRP